MVNFKSSIGKLILYVPREQNQKIEVGNLVDFKSEVVLIESYPNLFEFNYRIISYSIRSCIQTNGVGNKVYDAVNRKNKYQANK